MPVMEWKGICTPSYDAAAFLHECNWSVFKDSERSVVEINRAEPDFEVLHWLQYELNDLGLLEAFWMFARSTAHEDP